MHAPTITIRRATVTDRPAIEAILAATFEDTWRPQLSDDAASAYRSSGKTARFVAEAGADIRVAEIAGRIVGMIYWQGDFVDALHVPASHRRRGLAHALLAVAHDAMRREGFARARLETDTFNTASQAFYLAQGYRESDRYPDLEWNSGLTTILYVKDL